MAACLGGNLRPLSILRGGAAGGSGALTLFAPRARKTLLNLCGRREKTMTKRGKRECGAAVKGGEEKPLPLATQRPREIYTVSRRRRHRRQICFSSSFEPLLSFWARLGKGLTHFSFLHHHFPSSYPVMFFLPRVQGRKKRWDMALPRSGITRLSGLRLRYVSLVWRKTTSCIGEKRKLLFDASTAKLVHWPPKS